MKMDDAKNFKIVALNKAKVPAGVPARATDLPGIVEVMFHGNKSVECSVSAWDKVRKQQDEEIDIVPLDSVLGAKDDDCPLYLVSNSEHNLGADIIFSRKARKMIKDIMGDKVFVLPSSVHEVLVMRFDDRLDIDYLTRMVHEVNQSEVLPEERLDDRAYVLNL